VGPGDKWGQGVGPGGGALSCAALTSRYACSPIAWLNQFVVVPLNDGQRLALVYLRQNERMANPDYQRLNRVDSTAARQELRGLVQAGRVEQQSAKRWTYYTLKASRELPTTSGAPVTDEDKIIALVREKGSSQGTPGSNCCGDRSSVPSNKKKQENRQIDLPHCRTSVRE
jgi:hypothetical protein